MNFPRSVEEEVWQHIKPVSINFGHEVDVITQNYRGLKKEEIVNGMKVYRIAVKRKKTNTSSKLEMFLFVMISLFLIRKLIKKKKYDAVFAFFAIPSGFLAMLLLKFYKMPYIISMQGSDVPGYDPHTHPTVIYKILKPIIKKIWHCANFITANSDYMRNLALNFYSGAEIVTIHNGVDFDNYERLNIKSPRRRCFRIISVTRLVERKGLQHLFRSLPMIIKGVKSKIEVLIIGDGPYRASLEKIKKETGLGCVKFLGRIDHKELPKYYKNADLFVLLSTVEAFGVVFAEAMAAELPVVATNIGGIPEIVENGKTGILVPPKNKEKLANAVIKLINNKNLSKEMGITGKQRVQKYFTWEIIAKKYEKLFTEIKKR